MRQGKKYRELGLLYGKYRRVATELSMNPIEDVADLFNEDPHLTENNIQKLVDAKLFNENYIFKNKAI